MPFRDFFLLPLISPLSLDLTLLQSLTMYASKYQTARPNRQVDKFIPEEPQLPAEPAQESFKLFPKLPTELQLMIWALVLPKGRVVSIKDTESSPIATYDPVTLLHVNQEARELALKSYHLHWFPGFKNTFYLSSEHDILHIMSLEAMLEFCSEDVGPWSWVQDCTRTLAIDPSVEGFFERWFDWVRHDRGDGVYVYPIPGRFMRAFERFERLRELLILHPEVPTEDTPFKLTECLGTQIRDRFVQKAITYMDRKRMILKGRVIKFTASEYTFPVKGISIVEKCRKLLFSVPKVSTLAYSASYAVNEEGMRVALSNWSEAGEGSVLLKLD
jgi:hypothetical protein